VKLQPLRRFDFSDINTRTSEKFAYWQLFAPLARKTEQATGEEQIAAASVCSLRLENGQTGGGHDDKQAQIER
jgi:hypothetical protein